MHDNRHPQDPAPNREPGPDRARRTSRSRAPGRRAGRPATLALAVAAVGLLAAACASDTSTPPTTAAPPASTPTTTSRTGGPTSAPGTTVAAEPSFDPAPVAWSACSPAGYECGSVEVPLDYTKPGGRMIALAVKRRPATDTTTRIGSLFLNPGGPGSPGTQALETIVKDLDPSVGRRFDIVSWDPRGVGGSAPLTCDLGALDFYQTDLSATAPGPDVDAAAKKWADTCNSTFRDELPHLGTQNVTRDLETLRKAVGDDQLTYAGFSYGTLIGLLYAERYPTTVRAILLDGVVDPSLDVKEGTIQQAQAVDDAVDRFVTWCKAHVGSGPDDCAISEDPNAALGRLFDQARTDPLPGKIVGTTVYLSPTFVNFAITTATYDEQLWPRASRAFSAALQGDATELAVLANGYVTAASPSLNAAVNCLDTVVPKGAALEQMVTEVARAAPRLGVYNANSSRICEFWPVAPQPVPPTYRAAGAPTIMVWGTTGDNATPYANAVKIAENLESARLVTLVANQHAALGANDCVARTQAAYLIDLQVPPEGTKC